MADRQFADPRLAALYDPLCGREERADFRFYLPMVLAADAVLDVGCGTGALLHWARERGHHGRLVGLDPAAGMLEIARARDDIDWVLGDLGSTTWRGEFDLIVMTGHAFQVLVGDDELRSALGAIRSALTADGVFAFETRNPLVREWDRWTPDHRLDFLDAEGRHGSFSASVGEEIDGEIISFTTTYEYAGWAAPERSSSTLRFVDAPTLADLLVGAGLRGDEQFGDWDRSPLTAASPEIITLARPA